MSEMQTNGLRCEKLIRDGKVAILFSPGFGAGWYSWNDETPELLFDKDIVEAVLDGQNDKAAEIAQAKYEHIYTGGAGDLAVAWLPAGAPFEINEYDGSESVRAFENIHLTA